MRDPDSMRDILKAGSTGNAGEKAYNAYSIGLLCYDEMLKVIGYLASKAQEDERPVPFPYNVVAR